MPSKKYSSGSNNPPKGGRQQQQHRPASLGVLSADSQNTTTTPSSRRSSSGGDDVESPFERESHSFRYTSHVCDVLLLDPKKQHIEESDEDYCYNYFGGGIEERSSRRPR